MYAPRPLLPSQASAAVVQLLRQTQMRTAWRHILGGASRSTVDKRARLLKAPARHGGHVNRPSAAHCTASGNWWQLADGSARRWMGAQAWASRAAQQAQRLGRPAVGRTSVAPRCSAAFATLSRLPVGFSRSSINVWRRRGMDPDTVLYSLMGMPQCQYESAQRKLHRTYTVSPKGCARFASASCCPS